MQTNPSAALAHFTFVEIQARMRQTTITGKPAQAPVSDLKLQFATHT